MKLTSGRTCQWARKRILPARSTPAPHHEARAGMRSGALPSVVGYGRRLFGQACRVRVGGLCKVLAHKMRPSVSIGIFQAISI